MRDLSEHILDIFMNSIDAGASLTRVTVSKGEFFRIRIADNGRGMDPKKALRAQSAFFTSRKTRKYGLGLALLSQLAMQSGGRLKVKSRLGIGTVVDCTFDLSSIDMPPIGDIKATITAMAALVNKGDLLFTYKEGKKRAVIDTREVRAALGGETGPLMDLPGMFGWFQSYIAEEYLENGLANS